MQIRHAEPSEMEAYQLALDLLKAGGFRFAAKYRTASLWFDKKDGPVMLAFDGNGMPVGTRLDERGR